MKSKHTDNIFQNVFHYLLAVALSVAFALYINGRIGWFVTAIIVGAPVLSLILTLFFTNRVSCEYDPQPAVLCKGDKYKLHISFKNSFILPSPPVAVELKSSVRMRCGDKILCLFIPPKGEKELCAEFCAYICGGSHIGIQRITVKDYLGIFTFTPKSLSAAKKLAEISVMPDISEISSENTIIRKAVALSAYSDDSENTADTGLMTLTGFPGYEHRAYQPGDPLKRINWKLSAKRAHMLVRLDDHLSDSSITIILDSVSDEKGILKNRYSGSSSEDKELYTAGICEKCIESSLGITYTFLKKNYSVTYCMNYKNNWEEYAVSDELDLELLRQRLAAYKFAGTANSKRIPETAKSFSAILCTPYADKSLSDQVREINSNDPSIVIYSPQKEESI